MGFTPLNSNSQAYKQGFIPIEHDDIEEPSSSNGALETVKAIGSVYPVLETAANLASQAVAMPVAGLAGLGAMAGNAVGFTDADPVDVINKTAATLTYAPKTELGEHLTKATMYPLEKLAEVGSYAGDKTLNATGSPIAATSVDTTINMLPMAIGVRSKPKTDGTHHAVSEVESTSPHINHEIAQKPTNVSGVVEKPVSSGFTPTAEFSAELNRQRSEVSIGNIAKSETVDDAIFFANDALTSIEIPSIIRSSVDDALSNKVTQSNINVTENLKKLEIAYAMKDADSAAIIKPGDVQAKVDIGSGAIVTGAGLPYQTAATASIALKSKRLADSHEVVQVGDGFGLLPKNVEASTDSAVISNAIHPEVKTAQPAAIERTTELTNGANTELLQGAINNDTTAAGLGELHQQQYVKPMYEVTDGVTINRDMQMKNSSLTHENSAINTQRSAMERFNHEADALSLSSEINQPNRIADIRELESPNLSITSRQERQDIAIKSDSEIGFTPIDSLDANLKNLDIADNVMPDTEVSQVQNSFAQGDNYVGLGIDNTKTSGVLTDKPIRREDVLVPFMKALDTTMYEGRVKGKNRLGFYIPKLEAVRIKNKSDLEVAAHEIAHLIDDRVPELKKAYLNNKDYRNELRGVSYDASKLYEGYAEFMRLYMTQPEVARVKAPEFSKWFDDFANRHEYGSAIKKAQEGMTSWFNQDALHRAQSKIGVQKDLNGSLDGLFDRFRQATVDDLHGVYRMERELTGKTSPLGAYETARTTRGSGAMVDGAISIGAPVRKADGSFAFEGKGLEKILDPVTSELEQFLMYAVGRSSRELMMQGREKLFTKSEISAMLELEKPEYRQAFNDYQQWNRSVLDFAEAHGVVNKEIRQLFNRSQYLPFYRAGQSVAQKASGGVTGNWSGIKKLTGGDENLRPILGNMTQNAAMLIDAALKNEARMKIVELAKQEGGGKFMVKIDADSRPVKIDKAQVKDELFKAAGIDPSSARIGALDAEQAKIASAIEQATDQAQGLFEFLINNQAPQGNVMAVLKNGKPEYYEIADPLLYRAVSSLNRPAQNWLVSLLGWPKRIGQAAITLTPDFMVANIARDTIMASIMSKSGFKPFVDSVRGMGSRIAKDPAYQEFIANGGGFSSHLRNEETFKAHLERFYTSKGIDFKSVLDTPDKLMYGLETIADAFEMSSRLGEYKRMRAEGAHPRHAAYAAREISTDFAMKGDSRELGFLYDTVMFLRPAVVSMDRLARGLAHDENKVAIAAKSSTLALMSVGLYLLNKDNPEYQDMQDWDRDGHWHFFVPQQDGSSLHLRYPKIWEIGALASVSERTIANLLDQEPELGRSVLNVIGNVFNLNLMPQVIAPLYEQATNRNRFTKAPIETTGMEDIQPFLRAKPTTSESMKALGMATRSFSEGAQISPARAEALLRGYFNTWGMYGLMLSDKAFFDDKLPVMRADEMPVIRRFYSDDPAKHTKYETMFYDMLGEAKRLQGTIRELDEMDKKNLADEFDKNPKAGYANQLQRANKNLQVINRDINDVRASDMTKEDKRTRLDELTKERNELLKAIVTDADEGFISEE